MGVSAMSLQDFLRQRAMGRTGPMQKVMGFLGGPTDPMMSPEQNEQRAAQQRMAIAASLLQNSGPTPKGTTGLLQPFGTALQAGQQAGAFATEQIQRANADALRAKLMQAQMSPQQNNPFGVVNPSDFTPESMRKFARTGDYGDLVPVNKTFGRYTPSNYTTESWDLFTETQDPSVLELRPQYRTQETPGGGSVAVNTVDPTKNVVIRTPEEGTAEAATRAEAEGRSRERGGAAGRAEGALLAKAAQAGGIVDILEIAEPLIDEATGSGSGAIRDQLLAFFGESTTGDRAIGQLRVLQAALMLAQPRMEGPQSDRDVELYRQAAAELGDPRVPRARKKSALQTIRQLQDKYSENAAAYQPGVTEIVPNSASGPKVFKWSDL